MLPRRLAHFELVALLGEGGMGEVYRARDTRLGREVAVKILPESLAADAERLARFEREARVLASLAHPGIAALYDIGKDDGVRYLVMELVEGTTLAASGELGTPSPERFLALARELAGAVAAAHERGVVHRDLKPANVMLTPEGRLKVLDFGLARAREPQPPGEAETTLTEAPLTRLGVGLGTLPYMSPEQVRGEPAGAPSDVFSLGVVLTELATGRRPFGGATAADLASSILRDEPAPLSTLRPDLPAALDAVLTRCLAKSPGRRFRTAGEVSSALAALAGDPAPPPATVPERRRALAVLPLADRSPGGGEAYFAEGMTEALITDLSKVGGVRVIASGSALRYRDSDKASQEIAAELGVDLLVQGSILRLGERVRIQARLVRGEGDELLWAERYDRPLEDVLTLQAEVAEAIAHAVGGTLSGPRATAAERRAGPRRKVDPEVYLLDLQGRHQWNRRTEEGFRTGLRHFRDAVDRDPTYAPAWVGIADCYGMLANYGHQPPREIHPAARAAVDRALALDPGSAEAHRALAFVHWQFEFDWRPAIEEYERALALDPHSMLTNYWYGAYLGVIGDHDRGLELLAHAAELDPLSLLIPAVQGWLRYFARRFEEALPWYDRVLALDPTLFVCLWFRGETLVELGRLEEGIADLERALELSGGIARLHGYLGYACGRAGREEEARRHLSVLETRSAEGYVPPYFPALVHAGLGETGAALDLLELGYRSGDTMMRDLRADSQWDRMREEPRFAALMERMAFPFPAVAAQGG